jgi:hypothetical protein
MPLKIVTHYWPPPIPDRRFDWHAVTEDYEGGDGYDEPGSPVGYGRTKDEAVADLNEQLEDEGE